MEKDASKPITFESPDGKYGFKWHKDQGIYFMVQTGILDLESTHKLIEAYFDMQREHGGKYRVCADLTDLAEVAPAARSLLAKDTMGDDGPFERIAFVVDKFWMRTMMKLYVKVGRAPANVLATVEEAETWLRG